MLQTYKYWFFNMKGKFSYFFPAKINKILIFQQKDCFFNKKIDKKKKYRFFKIRNKIKLEKCLKYANIDFSKWMENIHSCFFLTKINKTLIFQKKKILIFKTISNIEKVESHYRSKINKNIEFSKLVIKLRYWNI